MAMLMTSLDKIFGLMTTPSSARQVTQVSSGAVSLRMLCCAMLMATLGLSDAVRAQQDVVFEPPVERDLTVAEISEEVSREVASLRAFESFPDPESDDLDPRPGPGPGPWLCPPP